MSKYIVRGVYPAGYGVYEKYGINRAKVIFEGTERECHEKCDELRTQEIQKYELIISLNHYYGNIFTDDPDPEMLAFYHKCYEKGIDSVSDVDSYAWLNTLFGYDIGWNKARTIITYLHRKVDLSALELDVSSKHYLQELSRKYNLSLKFGKWPDKNPIGIRYDFKSKNQ